jgi:hypothetical protein
MVKIFTLPPYIFGDYLANVPEVFEFPQESALVPPLSTSLYSKPFE